MRSIEITVRGRTPLLMNRFTDSDQLKASSGTSGAVRSQSGPSRDEVALSLYTADDGTIGIPQPNLFRCVIDAGKFSKIGRRTVTTQKSSLIPGCVDLEPIFIPIKHVDDWTIDQRPVRIPATGGRILRARPCFDDWELSFSVTLDDEVVSEDLFRSIIDNAGSKIGLGDYRPDCKGPFGKFVVVSWESSRL